MTTPTHTLATAVKGKLPTVFDLGVFSLGEIVPAMVGPNRPRSYRGNVRLRSDRLGDRVVQALDAVPGIGEYVLGAVDVRDPYFHRTEGGVPAWHQDDCGRAQLLASWANEQPTEIGVYEPGYAAPVELVPTEAGHLYVIDNARFLHRTPALTHPNDRWFVRITMPQRNVWVAW